MPSEDSFTLLPELTAQRLRRLRLRIPLGVVAVRAGVPATSLSYWERGLRVLTADQQRAVDAVLNDAEREDGQ